MEKGTGIIAIIVYLLLLTIVIRIGKKRKKNEEPSETMQRPRQELDLSDENALAACLVAAIDYREETKKNIRIISVKEVE